MFNKSLVFFFSVLFVLPSLAAPVPAAAPDAAAVVERDTIAAMPKAKLMKMEVSTRDAAPQDNEDEVWGGE